MRLVFFVEITSPMKVGTDFFTHPTNVNAFTLKPHHGHLCIGTNNSFNSVRSTPTISKDNGRD